MPSSGNDDDSRTALVGGPRSRLNGSTDPSRQSSKDLSNESKKRNRRGGKRRDSDVRDFVPQGGSFSANPLEIDPDSTSSSGSDSNDEDSGEDAEEGSKNNPNVGSTAPAINWNKGKKTAIRTTLGGRENNTGSKPTQFDTVNDKYWRPRSASASTDGGAKVEQDEDEDMEEGEVQDESSESGQMQESGDSDDSELDSEADDSILLNIGSKEGLSNGNGHASDDDDYDPESLLNNKFPVNGTSHGQSQSKEEALQNFSKKYPMAPTTLADLEQSDMETTARLMFYDQEINDINLQLPVACTECLREGHLAEVCPSKECVHCGAWNQHQSSFCPSWRRCQKCRQRGHDEPQCSSVSRSSASEVPCDFCASTNHLELECDNMWKYPQPEPPSGSSSVLVSLSCSHCTSNKHLLGDCPSLSRPLTSSSWTLRGIDPNTVTNINSVVSGTRGLGPRPTRGQRGNGGMKIRGRADHRSPSTDSDDLISRGQRAPIRGNANRGNIRIGSVGRGRNFGPGSRPDDRDYRDYRDRDYYGANTRQRSLSPNPRPGRGRGGNWGPPRSPPRSRGGGRPPPRGRGNGDRGGRGGRGSKRGGGEAYRPMPSSAKKNWDRYRL